MPVFNKEGKTIGVSQVLNKRGGSFNAEDEKRLAAFTSQISMGIENAKLFDDVQNQKNYSESILSSMHDAVLTLDETGIIRTCNTAGLRILKSPILSEVLGKKASDVLTESNSWLLQKLDSVEEQEDFLDAEIKIEDETLSVNVSVMPLVGQKKESLGVMLMIEDISSEKRMKSTMSR
jgi:adenylate cyclase